MVIATATPVKRTRKASTGPSPAKETTARYRLRTHTVSMVCESEIPKALIDNPDVAMTVIRLAYAAFQADMDRENFAVLCLNARGHAIAFKIVAVGTMTSCLVRPREIFGFAIREGAASVILAHNHPSGDPTPSPEDVSLTERMEQAGDLLGIPVMDHVILGDKRDTVIGRVTPHGGKVSGGLFA